MWLGRVQGNMKSWDLGPRNAPLHSTLSDLFSLSVLKLRTLLRISSESSLPLRQDVLSLDLLLSLTLPSTQLCHSQDNGGSCVGGDSLKDVRKPPIHYTAQRGRSSFNVLELPGSHFALIVLVWLSTSSWVDKNQGSLQALP